MSAFVINLLDLCLVPFKGSSLFIIVFSLFVLIYLFELVWHLV